MIKKLITKSSAKTASAASAASAAAEDKATSPSTPSTSQGDNSVSTSEATPMTTNKSPAVHIPKNTNNDRDSDVAKQRESLSTALGNGLEGLLLGSEFSQNRFEHFYTLKKKLMSGSFGTVYVGEHNLTKKEFAVKVIDRSKLSENDDKAQLREVDILRSLAIPSASSSSQHHSKTNEQSPDDESPPSEDPNENGIINLIDFYPSPTTYHMVMELARGGDVFDRLARRKFYTEKDARDLARSLLESIKFLHERGIAHRDIKPENLLLMNEYDDTDLKLADFGFARRFPLSTSYSETHHSMKTKCGTPAYVPPELIAGVPYGPGCDIWSAGCTLFMLLSGRPPFRIDTAGGKTAMFYKIRAGDYVFYDQFWGHISLEARKLVMSMLQVDPRQRVSAEEALRSDWILTDDCVLRRSSLEVGLKEIASFQARRKLKGAISAVMYVVGGKFWNIETAAVWRESMTDPETVATEEEMEDVEDTEAETKEPSPYLASQPKFEKYYTLDSELRAGKHAKVWQGTSVETTKSYAIKVVDRTGLSQAEDGAVLNEVAILKSLRHKHIVPLIDFFEDPEKFYLIMEKCNGGDVLDRICNIKQYSEKDARELSQGLLEAVEFMHSRGIAHRDLKPQNLLLENNADNFSVKICDFGYAKRVHVPQSLTTLCGSVHYVAPELLKNHPYDESADNWSVGVIIFFLLVGFLPFYSSDQQKLFQLIRLGHYRFDEKYWSNISEEAQFLIRRLLEVDPSKRYTATNALQSDWIMNIDDSVLVDRNLEESHSGIINEAKRMSKVARRVQWINNKKEQSFVNCYESA
mmetsp:Transcript_22648/g.43861  ORF Transcript_22648/g.43861 Transcript_22648/m.43861 type:complete len:808 (+) Transcript_22648:155-2578(+)